MVDVHGVSAQHGFTLPNSTQVLFRELPLFCCVRFWWESNCKWLTPVRATLAQVLPPLTLPQVEELPWDFGSRAFPARPSGAMGGLLVVVTAAEPFPWGDHGRGFCFPTFPASPGFSVPTSCWFSELKSARVGFIAFKSGTLTNSRQSLDLWLRFKHDSCRPNSTK